MVTGAGRGVGRAIASALAAEGAAVALWSRTPAELEAAREKIEADGGRARAWTVDVTDSAAVAEAARSVEAELGPVTLLVANAGSMSAVGRPWEVPVEEWLRDVDTSLAGTYLPLRALVPGMLERGSGRVVVVASNVALRPAPYQSGYAAGKAGLISLAEDLAAAGAEQGLRAFAVSPGFVDTEMTRRMVEAAEGEPWGETLVQGLSPEPLDPALVARHVVLIASGAVDSLSGRYFHALDDLEEIARRADEVREGDLYVPRVRKLSAESLARRGRAR